MPHTSKQKRHGWLRGITFSCAAFAAGWMTCCISSSSRPAKDLSGVGGQLPPSVERVSTSHGSSDSKEDTDRQRELLRDGKGGEINPASMMERQAEELLAHFRTYPNQLVRSDLLQLAFALGKHREVAALVVENGNELASRRLAAIWYQANPRSFDLEAFGNGACRAAATIGIASVLSRDDPDAALRLLEENYTRIGSTQDDLYLEVFAHSAERPIETTTAKWLLSRDPNDSKWKTCFRLLLRDIASSGSEEVVYFLQKVQNPEARTQMTLGAIGGAIKAENFDAAERYVNFLPPDRQETVRNGIAAKRKGIVLGTPD